MNKLSQHLRNVITTLAVIFMLASCAALDRNPGFDLTGKVLDAATKEPIEGAYVIAIYEASVSTFEGFKRHCVKARGMMTGKDGAFNFPIYGTAGNKPAEVSAIKPGYFHVRSSAPSSDNLNALRKADFSNWTVTLKKQDEANPNFDFGSVGLYCPQAEARADAEAVMAFYEIELSETIRLGGKRQWVDAIQSSILRMDSLRLNVQPAKK